METEEMLALLDEISVEGVLNKLSDAVLELSEKRGKHQARYKNAYAMIVAIASSETVMGIP